MIYEIIQQLHAAKGTIEKQAILDSQTANEDLKLFMKAVYDPAINYYIKKVPEIESTQGTQEFYFGVVDWLVSELATRRTSGKEAQKELAKMLTILNTEGKELVKMILKRSVGASVGETMVLNTWPGLFFIPPYMRCSGLDDKAITMFDAEESFYIQPKRDGSFAYLVAEASGCQLITRSGNSYPKWFAEMLAGSVPYDVVLCGELEVYSNGKLLSRKEGNGILNSIQHGADWHEVDFYEFKLIAWDFLTTHEFSAGQSQVPYKHRLANLEATIWWCGTDCIDIIETHEVKSFAEADKYVKKWQQAGGEGGIAKTKDGIWKDGTSKHNVKMKVKFAADYLIEGYYEGEGKAAGMLGGLKIASSCGKLRNNVGSGFSDDQRKYFWSIKEQLIGKIVECEANDVITKRGSDTIALSLPIFVEIREDKKVADTYERVLEQLEAAKKGKE